MYSGSPEQLRDYERLLCVYLSEYMDTVVRAKSVTDTPFEKYKGLVISLEEAENAFSPRAFSLSEQGEQRVAEIWAEISESSAQSEENGVFLPLDRICRAFGFGTCTGTKRNSRSTAGIDLQKHVARTECIKSHFERTG